MPGDRQAEVMGGGERRMWLLILLVVALCVTGTLCTPDSWQPWVQFGSTALVVAAATVRIRRRPLVDLLGTGRPVRGGGPGRRGRSSVEVVELVSEDRTTTGCVDSGRIVTTAVELSAGSGAVTCIGGSSSSGDPIPRVPLAVLAGLLDQSGAALEGIDVTVRGRRSVDEGPSQTYDLLVGPLPVVSHRRVTLLLRFDLLDPATGVGLRGPEDRAAELTVGVATERIRRSLVHHGFGCRTLDADDLANLYRETRRESDSAEPGDGLGLVVPRGVDPVEVDRLVADLPVTARTDVVRLRRIGDGATAVRGVYSIGLLGVAPETVPDALLEKCLLRRGPAVAPVPMLILFGRICGFCTGV